MAQPAGDMPQSFGHYDVESVLGRGAMGMVYLARDRRIGRRVALKTVHVNEKFEDESDAREFYKRLQREAELCGSLQHPNIVTLYEPGYENNVIAWLATEFVDGENLRDRLRRKKPLPLTEALRIAEHILRGLAYAHAKGIVHRDIKPANILLTSTGDAKLADFGIARPQDSTLTAVGEMLGTPSYMSPEQVKTSPVTTRSDLFSLGAVLYEMVTGLKAFAASDVTGILRNVVEGSPKAAHEVNPEVPQSMTTFINRLIAKNPEDRYPSAVEALDDLEKLENEILSRSPATDEVAKDVDDALTLSLRAQQQQQQQQQDHPTGATAPDFNDATPAVGSRPTDAGSWSRPVPASVFWPVVLLAVLAAGSGLYSIRSQTNAEPTVTYSPAQLRSFATKKQALQNARALFRAGRMEESLAAYDAYVGRYPESVVAQTERADVAGAIERAKAASTRVTVTAPEKSSRRREEPQKEAPKKSIWRRIFGGGSKQEPKKP